MRKWRSTCKPYSLKNLWSIHLGFLRVDESRWKKIDETILVTATDYLYQHFACKGLATHRDEACVFRSLFAVSVAQKNESMVCILSIAVWWGAFWLRSWPKTKFGEEMTESQWRNSSWSEESWPEVYAHDDGNIFFDGPWEVPVRMRHVDVPFEKKSFWRTAEQRRVLPVKGIHQQKKIMLAHFFAPKWQQNIVCSVIALLALQWEDFSNGLFIVLVALAVVKTLLFLYESQLLAFSRLRNSSIFFQVTRSLEHTKASLWKNT